MATLRSLGLLPLLWDGVDVPLQMVFAIPE
jgi:hypothetical protein